METYSVKAVLSVSDQSFSSKMSGAVKAVDQLETGGKKATASIKDIASGIGVFKALSMAVNTLKSSLDGAISRFDTLNQYPKVMQQIGFSSEKADASVNRLSEGIDGLPTSLDSIVSSTQGIAVLTRDIDKATETSIALNDAFLASGSATADAERGLTQYVQMLSKGEVDLQSWRSLQETMGPALYEIAAAFGYAGSSAQNDLYDALRDGLITFDQFNDKLIELDSGVNGFAERARTASAGVGTSLENLQTAVVRGMEKVIRAADSSLTEAGFPNFQQALEMTKTKVNETFTYAATATEKFIGIAAPGVHMVIDNLDALIPVLGAAAAGFVSFKAAMSIQDKVQSLRDTMAEATERIKAVNNVTELNERAVLKQEKAILATMRAERVNTDAIKAQEVATKEQRKAQNLTTKATNAQKKAQNAATEAERLKTQAIKDQEAADRAAKRVQESKTASTKLQEKAEIAAAKAEESRIAATEAETAATKLQTRADTLNAKATEVSAKADTKSAIASELKTEADKANAFAATAEMEAEIANAAATSTSTKAAEMSSLAIIAKTAVLGVLSGEMTVATAVQWAWNAAMKANPIGAVITLIAALTVAIVAVTKAIQKYCEKNETLSYRQKQSKKSAKELTEALEESKDAYKETYKETKNCAGAVETLTEKTIKLANKKHKTAAEIALLQSNVESLNSSMEDLNLVYDEETDSLNMSTEALKKKAEAYKLQAIGEVYAERYKEILEEQLDVEDQLAESTQLLQEAQDKYNASMESTGTVSAFCIDQLDQQKKTTKEFEDQLNSLEQEEQELADKISECQLEATEATEAAAEAQIESNESVRINLEELSDAQQDTLDRVVNAYETMTGSLGSLNSKIEEDDELTWSKVKKNQEDTIKKTKEFADLYTQLIDAGISESYLNAIGATGPEALPLLEGMMKDGVDKVKESQSEWEAAYDSISDSFVDSLQLSDEDKATIKSYIAGESGVLGTLQSAIEAADFSPIMEEAAEDTIKGYTNGIESGLFDIRPLGIKIGEFMREGTEESLGIGSPSKVYNGYGQDTIQGYINGIKAKQNELDSAMKKIMSSAGKTASTSLNKSLNAMSLVSTSAFSKISVAARNGMRTTSAEILSGMNKSNTVVKSGMLKMSAEISTGMKKNNSVTKSETSAMNATIQTSTQKMQSLMTVGMQRIVQAVNAGMNSAKVQTVSSSNSMVSQVSGLRSRFYDSGYYASLGLAKGIDAGSGQAISAARRLANTVSTTINRALEIRSPSRVTMESGKFTAEGLAFGMMNSLNIVKKASEKIARAAVPTGEISRMATSAGEYAVDTSFSYAGDVDATYSFVIPVVIDGREAGRAMATYTQKELDKQDKLNKYMKGYR